MKNNLVSNHLLPKGRLIYFNEEHHKYTDDLQNPYISVTTIIHKYIEEFKSLQIAEACARIGRNPAHKDYLKYKGKSKEKLLLEWKMETERACKEGTAKHDFLEDTIKSNNGYKVNAKGFIEDRIYTIDDIITHHSYGVLTLKKFEQSGVKEKYPTIYNIIEKFSNAGFKIYAEIGVYDYQFLISGLIDVLLVRGEEFVILDWKTNKAPIKFEAGYYVKNQEGKLDFDNDGNILNEFRYTGKFFQEPLSDLEDSVGNHYAMQLSTYAHLVETFGFRCKAIILCHIRTIPAKEDSLGNIIRDEFQVVDINGKMPYYKSHVEKMFAHYANNNSTKTNLTLF